MTDNGTDSAGDANIFEPLEYVARAPGANAEAEPLEYAARAPGADTGDRVHLKCGGRFVSVIRLGDGSLAAVDSICYHAGGSLGLGAIEDGDRVICPQHKYRVCLRTGAAFAGGDRAAVGRRQRVHVAYEVDGALRVRPSTGGALASDRFAGARETSWHDVMWREVRVAAAAEGAAP